VPDLRSRLSIVATAIPLSRPEEPTEVFSSRDGKGLLFAVLKEKIQQRVPELAEIRGTFGLSKTELADLLHRRPQTRLEWETRGVPLDMRASVERLVLDSVVPPEPADPFNRSSFAAVRRVLTTLCSGRRCAGVTGDRLGCHRLRSACATQSLLAGANLAFVQQLLGHEDVSTTQRYVRFLDDDLRRQRQESRSLIQI